MCPGLSLLESNAMLNSWRLQPQRAPPAGEAPLLLTPVKATDSGLSSGKKGDLTLRIHRANTKEGEDREGLL